MPETIIVTAKTLSEYIGISTRWVANLSEREIDGQPVCVKTKRGKFDLKASVQGYAKYLREEAKAGTAPAQRKLLAQAEIAEIDLSIKKDEVLHIEDVLDTVTIIVSNVQTRLLNCPTEIATEIEDGMSRAEKQATADRIIRDALTGFAEAKASFTRKPSGRKKAL